MKQTSSPTPIWNIANYLTMLRIILVPAVIVLLMLVKPEQYEHNWWNLTAATPLGWNRMLCFLAMTLFILAALTDFYDGYLARKHNLITTLGKFLDPLADKIMVISVMVMLVQLGRLPGWMVIIIISREVSITALRSIASSQGIVIAASNLGKYKTVFQITALVCVLIYYDTQLFNLISINVFAVGMFFFVVAFILTIWSGLDYFKAFRKVMLVEENAD